MTHQDLRQKFRNFFESRGHTWISSSSLLPTDSSVLFTTAGMQQFKPYYTGQKDAQKDFDSLNTASIQKSMRTSDIDEIGDESHLTFFEMLGNFSFGGYWKKEAIVLAHDFITKELNLKIDYVTVFKGEGDIPADNESENIWREIDLNLEVRKMDKEDNFWGPTGNEGPCGPTTEIYVNGIEIWNIVFNEFFKNKEGQFSKLEKPGIDTGMGLERLTMVVQNKNNIFETDLFSPIIEMMPNDLDIRTKRIVADHSRAIVFLLADGVRPSNKDQGYVLRRLIRRVIVHSHVNNFIGDTKKNILRKIISMYKDFYPELNEDLIIQEFIAESDKFGKTLHNGLRELDKTNNIDAESAFRLYESFGLPFEIIKELGDIKAKNLEREDFETEFKKHQEKSRAGADKKFGGHGLILDNGELKAGNEEDLIKVTRLHTATHLLNQALHMVLGDEVSQAGSDITPERLRFDFTFPRKLTDEEITKIENIINEAISKDYRVIKEEMSLQEAIKSGARSFFKQKYPDLVNVYSILDDSGKSFSRELCGGPHVNSTKEIGNIKIKKEESVSAGTRRIRASVQ